MIEGLRRSSERDCGYLIYTSDMEVLIDYESGVGEYDDKVTMMLLILIRSTKNFHGIWEIWNQLS